MPNEVKGQNGRKMGSQKGKRKRIITATKNQIKDRITYGTQSRKKQKTKTKQHIGLRRKTIKPNG